MLSQNSALTPQAHSLPSATLSERPTPTSPFTGGFRKSRLAELVAGTCSPGGLFSPVACSFLLHPRQSELRTTTPGNVIHIPVWARHGAELPAPHTHGRPCSCCLCFNKSNHLHAKPLWMVLVRFFCKLRCLLWWDSFWNVQNPPERFYPPAGQSFKAGS